VLPIKNSWVCRTLDELEHGHLISGVLCSIIHSYTQTPLMTDTEKLTLLLKVLKEYAEAKTCYDVYGDDYTPSADSYDTAFEDGADYGEIHLARTLLEQIGVEFQYPMMKEND
jgi:hypothetical protein